MPGRRIVAGIPDWPTAALSSAMREWSVVGEVDISVVAATGIKAGFLKCAIEDGLTSDVERVLKAVQVVSDTRTFYDDPTFATTFPQASAPSKGNVTMVRHAADYAGGAFTYQTTARSTYDTHGRILNGYDVNGNLTTAYTLNSVGLTTEMKVTNPLDQFTTSTLDQQRGDILTATDANGLVDRSQYDALGGSPQCSPFRGGRVHRARCVRGEQGDDAREQTAGGRAGAPRRTCHRWVGRRVRLGADGVDPWAVAAARVADCPAEAARREDEVRRDSKSGDVSMRSASFTYTTGDMVHAAPFLNGVLVPRACFGRMTQRERSATIPPSAITGGSP
jgi:hypothetical protein